MERGMKMEIGHMFPSYFDKDFDYFKSFHDDHVPQLLSESDKGDVAYRKGIYLSDVTEDGRFWLLRCSSNLRGPTDNFSPTDRMIIARVNETAQAFFPGSALLNHVLAQVYHNHSLNGKQRRAKIARHSDKTKDMPVNGLMAFCTFYDWTNVPNRKMYKVDPNDHYNILYKHSTALTILRFIPKSGVDVGVGVGDQKQIDVLLYPNSVFLMDLETNRLYTHEIVPPNLDSIDIPTRLGYVIRCSKQEAKFEAGQTWLRRSPSPSPSPSPPSPSPPPASVKKDDEWEPLRRPTVDDIARLKELYRVENATTERPDYGFINFSLNDGDYLSPIGKSTHIEPSAQAHCVRDCSALLESVDQMDSV